MKKWKQNNLQFVPNIMITDLKVVLRIREILAYLLIHHKNNHISSNHTFISNQYKS